MRSKRLVATGMIARPKVATLPTVIQCFVYSDSYSCQITVAFITASAIRLTD